MEEPYVDGILVPPTLAVPVQGAVTAVPTAYEDADACWTDEASCYAEDTAYAVLDCQGANLTGLLLTGFDLSALPATAVITGISVTTVAKMDFGDGAVTEPAIGVRLTADGGSTYTSAQLTALDMLTDAESSDVLGGTEHLWGYAWTVEEVQDDENFGVCIRPHLGTVSGDEDMPTLLLNSVVVTVHFQRLLATSD